MGGTIETPSGQAYWCGNDWELACGPATAMTLSGRINRVTDCLLPDGSRGPVKRSLEHDRQIRMRKDPETGETRVEIINQNIFKREQRIPGKPLSYVFGTIAVSDADIVFTDLNLGRAEGRQLRGMEIDLDASDSIREACQDDDIAVELYAALCNVTWRKGAESYDCSWRHAGGVVAELRGHNESYVDFYCAGNEGEVTDRIADFLKAIGWEPEGDQA